MLKPIQAGSEQSGLEVVPETVGLLIAARLFLATPCPDNWMITLVVSGFGTTAALAEADAVKLAKVVGKLAAPDYEKTLPCERFSCDIEESDCVFDWGLIGKPTPGVEMPPAKTELHNIEVKGKWESTQKIGFGCFCVSDL